MSNNNSLNLNGSTLIKIAQSAVPTCLVALIVAKWGKGCIPIKSTATTVLEYRNKIQKKLNVTYSSKRK